MAESSKTVSNNKGFLVRTFSSFALGVGGAYLGQNGLGPVNFNSQYAPYILGGAGASLPPLWWLLSSLPPKPIKEYFPAMRLLFNADLQTQKPSSMHWLHKTVWLSTIAAGALYAADLDTNANVFGKFTGTGPVVLPIDNDYSSVENWGQIETQISSMLDSVDRQARDVVLLPTASSTQKTDTDFGRPVSVNRARILMQEITPKPWPSNYDAYFDTLDRLNEELTDASVFWMNNGIENPNTQEFLGHLQDLGPVHVFQPDPKNILLIPSLVETPDNDLIIRVTRANLEKAQNEFTLNALNEAGEIVVSQDGVFEEDAPSADVKFEIPHELRRQLVKMQIQGQSDAGSSLILDENWRERSVGLIKTPAAERLSNGTDYVRAAIFRFTELYEAEVDGLNNFPLSVRVMTDEANLLQSEEASTLQWVEEGGMLIRFAGPNLANNPNDPLVPVELRRGIISTEDSFSERQDIDQSQVGKIASFTEQSPFNGFQIPEDVRIDRIVMPQPGLELEAYTWAKLSDGTPLVTARKQGDGWIVLFHTSANPEWSNLPLTESFLDMMRASVAFSQGDIQGKLLNRNLQPLQTLTVNGGLIPASKDVRPLTPQILESKVMNAQHRPGVYGDESTWFAYNVSDAVVEYKGWNNFPEDVSHYNYTDQTSEYDPKDFLLAYAWAAIVGAGLWQIMQNGNTPSQKSQRAGFFGRRRDAQEASPEVQ